MRVCVVGVGCNLSMYVCVWYVLALAPIGVCGVCVVRVRYVR